MKVKELIEQLKNVKNQDVEVFIYYSGNNDLDKNSGLAYVDMVDDTITDRVDINCVD